MQSNQNLSFHKFVLDPSHLRISANLRFPSNISYFRTISKKRLDLEQIILAICDPKLGFGRDEAQRSGYSFNGFTLSTQ